MVLKIANDPKQEYVVARDRSKHKDSGAMKPKILPRLFLASRPIAVPCCFVVM